EHPDRPFRPLCHRRKCVAGITCDILWADANATPHQLSAPPAIHRIGDEPLRSSPFFCLTVTPQSPKHIRRTPMMTTQLPTDSSQETTAIPQGPYKRILLKLSGESLSGPHGL